MLSFARDIRPLFTPEDVEHMLDVDPDLDLGSYASVRENADDIERTLASGTMPPGQPWPAEQVALFRRWMDEGFPE